MWSRLSNEAALLSTTKDTFSLRQAQGAVLAYVFRLLSFSRFLFPVS